METRHKRWEYLGIALFFTTFVFGILLLGGTITSGLHLVDDHEFFRYDYEMSQGNKTLWEMISYELEIDLLDRFRPLYYPLRVIRTWIFGTNLVTMSVLQGIESDNTAAIWLHTKGIDNVYSYQGGTCVDWYENGIGNTIQLDEVDIIPMYNHDDRHYLAEPDVDLTDFDIEVFHTVRVAVRKDYL